MNVALPSVVMLPSIEALIPPLKLIVCEQIKTGTKVLSLSLT